MQAYDLCLLAVGHIRVFRPAWRCAMAYVIAAPEMMTAAAADLAVIGSTLDAANATAAAPTIALLSAAPDEVSTGIAQLFSDYAEDYQELAKQASAFHTQFVHQWTASAAAYAGAEAVNAAALLQPLTATVVSVSSVVAAIMDFLHQIVHSVVHYLDSLFPGLYLHYLPDLPITLLASGILVSLILINLFLSNFY